MNRKNWKNILHNIQPTQRETEMMLQKILSHQNQTVSFPFFKLCLVPIFLLFFCWFIPSDSTASKVKMVLETNSELEYVQWNETCYRKIEITTVEYLGEPIDQNLFYSSIHPYLKIIKQHEQYFLVQEVQCLK